MPQDPSLIPVSLPDAQPHNAAEAAFAPWFLGIGMLILLLGGLAFGHLAAAAVISSTVIGSIVLLGGLFLFGHALVMRTGGFLRDWGLGGLFYLLAGLAMLLEPLAGARLLTLALAACLTISGISRLVVGTRLQGSWMLASGAVSIMAGTVIAMDWPAHSLWVLGFLVAFDLAVIGVTMIGTGITLRWIHR